MFFASILLVVFTLFASQTVNAQFDPTIPVSAKDVASEMQPIVGIDFGGFMYNKIEAEANNTIYMEMKFTNPQLATALETAPKEKIDEAGIIMRRAILQNPQMVTMLKSSKLNIRLSIVTDRKFIYEDTILYTEL